MSDLSNSEIVAAAQYNRRQRLGSELIRRIQRFLHVREDGDPGPITSAAIARWQAGEDLEVDGKLGRDTLGALEDEWRAEERAHRVGARTDEDDSANDEPTLPDWLVDLQDAPRIRKRGLPKGSRGWHGITGITLHQTAVDFGGPEHARVIDVPVHAMTFQDGRACLLNPPTALMYHGNGFNGRDIGVEVSCRAAGIEGVFAKRRGDPGPNTLWRSPSSPDATPLEASDQQLDATRKLVRFYVELTKRMGGAIEFIHAHRQSSAQRESDPGSRIWQEVGIWAQQEFDLSAGPPGWCLDGGMPIPTAWDPRVPSIPYNWKVKGY